MDSETTHVRMVARQAIQTLGLEEGDAILVQPQTRYDCDAAYVTHAGGIIRLATPFREDVLRISHAPGVWVEIEKAEAEAMIAGRIKKVLKGKEALDA